MAAPQGQGARGAADLVTHSTVTIERPASVIWPYIIDPGEWKQGLSLRHHAGERDAVGEVFAAFDPADPDTIAFFIENSELVPGRRRTIKLYEPGPRGGLLGFATWTLTEDEGGTLVTYDVYSETLLPPDQAARITPQQLAEIEQQGHELNQPRFDRELMALKALVEERH